jgi:hypothetical protein
LPTSGPACRPAYTRARRHSRTVCNSDPLCDPDSGKAVHRFRVSPAANRNQVNFPDADFGPTSKSAIKCRIRLRGDSGRSSNRNRHLSPSVNTSRLPITNRKWRAPAVATNGYGRERIGSKKDNLRGERRSSGRRASYRSRYGRLSCTDMKFSRSIQFSQSRMVSGSSATRSAVALKRMFLQSSSLRKLRRAAP